jgi:hypothetical protein
MVGNRLDFVEDYVSFYLPVIDILTDALGVFEDVLVELAVE